MSERASERVCEPDGGREGGREGDLGGVPGELEHLGGEVLQDGSAVDGGGGAHAALGGYGVFQEAVDATNRELRYRQGRHGQMSSAILTGMWGEECSVESAV